MAHLPPAPLPAVSAAAADCLAAFHAWRGRPPLLAAWAPGRINLIGEHVDYCGGLVLPLAIQRQAVVALGPSGDACTRIRSTAFAEVIEVRREALAFPRPTGTFADRILGVLAAFERGPWAAGRGAAAVPPVELLVHSDVPVGGGLSSSAAVEAATATAVAALLRWEAAGPHADHRTAGWRSAGPAGDEVGVPTGRGAGSESSAGARDTASEQAAADIRPGTIPRQEVPLARLLAECCQWSEHEAAGVPCGIMDMLVALAAQAGHAVLIDCRSLEWSQVPIPQDAEFLVIDTRTRHDHASGAYAERRRQCEQAAADLGVEALRDADEELIERSGLTAAPRKRALHVASELRRVREFVEAMRRGDLERMGGILLEGHASLRDHFEVSAPELDHVVEVASALRGMGVFGARLTGGGFGGCAIVLVKRGRGGEVAAAIRESFRRRFEREIGWFVAESTDGAAVLPTDAWSRQVRPPTRR